MKHELIRALQIFKKQGIKSASQKTINYIVRSFQLRKCKKDIKETRKIDNIEALVDSVLNKWKGLIRPLQIQTEITDLIKYLSTKNIHRTMEIGTANGGTLFLLCRITSPDGQIISVDLPCGPFGGGYAKWKTPLYKEFASEKQKLSLLRENSHEKSTLQKIEKILNGEKLDFLFIDGDHTYEGVKRDFNLYKNLVKKGGFIGFHDIAKHTLHPECKVDVFWQELKKKYKFKEIVENKNQGWAGIGIIQT